MSGDFKEHFDLTKLDENQIGQIEFVLNSPAYVDSFRPYLLGIISQMNDLWKDRTQARRDQYPDDFLAGGIVFGEGLIKFFNLLLEETKMERIHKAMEGMTNEKLYDMKRQAGGQRPVVGFDQPVLPGLADPDEF